MERITSRFQSIPWYVPYYGISVVIGLDEPRYRRQKGRQYTRRYMEPDGYLSNYPRPRAVALSGGVTALGDAPRLPSFLCAERPAGKYTVGTPAAYGRLPTDRFRTGWWDSCPLCARHVGGVRDQSGPFPSLRAHPKTRLQRRLASGESRD